MSRNKRWLSAAALAASSVQAVAAVPQTASPNELPAVPAVAGSTGLTAADLIVGRDGALCIDVGAPAAKVTADDSSANPRCREGGQNGC
ncbi:MAG: hypothetical protein ABR878_04560 [Roseiarcus sp.]|jgi:cytochrome c5